MPNASNIRAVLFDLDDTLYPERSYVESGFRAVAAHLARVAAADPDALFRCMLELLDRDGRGRIFDHAIERFGLAGAATVEELVAVYRHHRPSISLYPEVPHALARLRESGLRLAIVTDGLLCMQENKVAALGVERLVDAVVCTDALGRDFWKPHPAAFRAAAEKLGVDPRNALFVGNDPAKDIPAPLELEMQAIHICRASNPAANPAAGPAAGPAASPAVSPAANCCRASAHIDGLDAVCHWIERRQGVTA